MQKKRKKNKKDKGGQSEVKWVGAGVRCEGITYFRTFILQGDLEVSVGDAVLVQPKDSSIPHNVAKISNMFEGPEGATAHLIWYGRAADTVIGWTDDEREIYQWPHCQDSPLLSILQKCKVLGRQELPAEGVEDDGVRLSSSSRRTSLA